MRMRKLSTHFVLFLFLFCAVVAAESGTQTPDKPVPKRMRRLFIEVEDGDTIIYRGRYMRFLGVDTPEIRNPDVGFYTDQPFGTEAKNFTRRQIKTAKKVTYVSDGLDYYDRLLVHIFVDGYPLSVRIIEAGFGYETVSVYGDNGFPEVAQMILNAAKLYPDLPFENPYLWRRKNRH